MFPDLVGTRGTALRAASAWRRSRDRLESLHFADGLVDRFVVLVLVCLRVRLLKLNGWNSASSSFWVFSHHNLATPPGERALPWESQESLHLFHRKRRADPGHLLCGIGVAVGMILFVV